MAYDASLKPDKKNSTMNILSPSSTDITAQSNMPGVSGQQAPEQSAPQTRSSQSPSSGSYGNLKAFIKANQGSGQRIGSALGQQVQSTIGKAGKEINQAQEQFKSVVDAKSGQAATEQGRQNMLESAKNIASQQATSSYTPESTQLNQEQAKAFQEAINAKYSGPRSLEEAGLYGNVAQNIKKAEDIASMTKDAQGRRNLLKQTFSKDREYTRGSQNLDELLLNKDPNQVQKLQDLGVNAGNLQQQASQVISQAKNQAAVRGQEIDKLRSDARTQFSKISNDRQNEIENRLSAVVEGWDQLPEYFRNTLRENAASGAVNLSNLEAQTLGVNQGEGFYNLLKNQPIENLIKTNEASKEKLISQQEQQQLARLQELANLADNYGTQGSGVEFRSNYTNKDLAGTQTALDALDLSSLRNQLNEAEQNFRNMAQTADIKGYGSDWARYNKGGFQGRGKVYMDAEQSANLGDLLSRSGYDLNKELSTQQASPETLKILAKVQDAASRGQFLDTSSPDSFMDSLYSVAGEDSKLLNALNLGQIGEIANLKIPGQLLQDVGGMSSSFGSGLSKNLFGSEKSLLGQAVTSPLNVTGNIASEIGRSLQSVGSNLFGGGKSAAKSKAKAGAEAKAIENLKQNVQNTLNQQGFSNRVNIADDAKTQARTAALMDILNRIDKTNL